MFSKELGTKLDQYHLLKHPFYQIFWNEGRLTREIIKDYAEQYYQHVKAFPRYISATHSICDDIEKRKILLENLQDEENKDGDHPKLWKNFAKAMGADEKRIEELSREYDFMPLKRILLSESFEFKHSEETSIFHLVSHFDFWEDFLQNNDISCIFTEVPSILSTTVLWVVCKKLGIECISFGNWCIDGRIIFSKEWGCYIVDYEDTFNHIEIDTSSEDYRLSYEYLTK